MREQWIPGHSFVGGGGGVWPGDEAKYVAYMYIAYTFIEICKLPGEYAFA